MRSATRYVLAIVLLSTSALAAMGPLSLAASPVQAEMKQPLLSKEQLLEASPGPLLELKLWNKQKILGWVGRLNSETFEFTCSRGGEVIKQQIFYGDVKSYKAVKGQKRCHVLLYTPGVIGLVFVRIISAATKRD